MRILKLINWPQAWHLFLSAIAFSFPFGKNTTSLLLIGFVVISAIYWLTEMPSRKMNIQFKLGGARFLLLLPILYYVWTAFGILYTENLNDGATELSKRISFLFVPAIFLLLGQELDKNRINVVLKWYMYGILVSACLSVLLGFYYSTNLIDGQLVFRTAVNEISYDRGDSFLEQPIQGGNYFFGSYISPFIKNIIYYAIQLSFGFFLALFGKVSSSNSWNWKNMLFSSILFIVLFFCDSRGPLISFFCTLLIIVVLTRRNKYFWRLLPVVVLTISIGVQMSPRVSLLIKDFHAIRSSINYHSTESTALRIIVWETAIKIIKEHPFLGVGTGDSRDAMQEQTRQANQMAYEKRLNAHNQYFETLMTGGIVGFMTLMMLLVRPFYFSIKANCLLLSSFIMIIGLNMLFESTFQVFQGIQFFVFFYCILIEKASKRDESIAVIRAR